jgi:competence protein ComEC
MEVHFIDVGQGDCTLVIVGDRAMLIDAGDGAKGTLVQNYLSKRGIDRLDYLVLTHPDADHIGGAPVIITKFQVDRVFVSNYEKDNRTYQKLIEALDNKRYKYSTPLVGEVYGLGEAEFMILAPNATYSNPNDSSVALLLTHGNNTFLFTGDAEERAERDIVSNGYPLAADVLHAGHHGSRSSSSTDFLEMVMPEYAVISCEEGNQYGHPHAQTMNTYRSMGIKVFRTDEQGSIVATSNGERITWSCAPSETWQQGEPTAAPR